MIIAIVGIIVLLIAVNALYVAAEFAAVSVRRSRVQQLAEEGNGLARSLLPILQKPELLDRYIAGCQIGITISSLVLGAYGQATIPGRLEPLLDDLGWFSEAAAQSIAAIIVLLFLTATQVVLGELVPKSLALQFPARVALYTTLPMQYSLVALRPFIAILNGSALAVLRLFGAGHASHTHTHSPEELELLIMQSADGGLLDPDERSRLRKALQLGNLAAADVMVPRQKVLAFEAQMTIAEASTAIARSPYTRVPVYRDSIDEVLGLLHAKDLAAYEGEAARTRTISEIARPMVTIPESLPVERVLVALRAERAQQALVIDEHGGVAGLLTLEDVLSEIFGTFGDEFKSVAEADVQQLPGGGTRLAGSIPYAFARKIMPVDLPGASHTLAGRVIEMLGHLPAEGEEIALEGARIVVESVAHRAIVSVVVYAAETLEVNDAV
jgi:CBS domain containing-hemolysin-like protein